MKREVVIGTDEQSTHINKIGLKKWIGGTRNWKGASRVIWGNQGDNEISGERSKGLAAVGTWEPTCEELWVTGMGFCCARSVSPQEGTLDGCWGSSRFHL